MSLKEWLGYWVVNFLTKIYVYSAWNLENPCAWKSWRHICVCTPFLTDKEMQDRILGIVSIFPKNEPFTANIHYHKRCWDKYTSNISTKKCWEHVQGVTSKEVDAVFTDHVQRTVLSAESTSNIKRFIKRLP